MKSFYIFLLLSYIFSSTHSQAFVKHKIMNETGLDSETYSSMTFNGAWCWFSDPRAVYYEGKHKRTYTGWVDNYGDLHIGQYDHETQRIHSHVIYDNLEIDDHDNPSIIFDDNGRLIVFFNMHMRGEQPLFMIKSKNPENIESWGPVKELFLNEESLRDLGSMNHTYTNPVRLSEENGRIYLFWRGVDGKPCFSYTDDDGEKWAPGKIFFMPERIYGFRRPYTKIYSDGKSRIHFVLTDGHPRRENENSIYYMYYEGGSFFRANNEKICDMDDLPVKPEETDKVYDASLQGAKAWNWDIAVRENEKPVIAYVKFPDDSSHIYCYAQWDGKSWQNFDLINSGKWFPETPEGVTEPEPNYSGGMSIDKETPGIVYLSVNRDSIFEIEKWTRPAKGKTWKVEKITSGSGKNNVRPFAIRGSAPGTEPQVLWMQNTKYLHFAYGSQLEAMGGTFKDRFHSSIKMDIVSPAVYDPMEKKDILAIMHKAADWQLSNPRYDINPIDWHYGAFYTGLRALYELDPGNRYLNELLNIGQHYNWRPMDEIFHADRLTIIDNWAWIYGMDPEPGIIDDSKWVCDIHLARNYAEETDVRFENNPYRFEWWTWCDALFMAPPSFVQVWKATGEEKYLDYMDTQWWKTSDYLYSKEDSLYFRDDRFFEERTPNGKKVFWSRGNGWVIAGLARILDKLPEDYANRNKFEDQFRQMAGKLLSIQGEDGLWRVSLLDPDYLDTGESSGSAFFTYALAWGINNGLIDEKYTPKVIKAWTALCKNVNNRGRLGWVQQVAGNPYPFYEYESHVYATGAFLHVGRQMYILLDK